MTEQILTKPDPGDQKILEKLQLLLEGDLEQVPEIKWHTQGYTVNQAGAVVGLGLYEFGIDDKKLKELAESLTSLTSLTTLNLINNQLTDISVMKELPNLTWLNLSSNPLTDISVLKELSNLTRLGLRGNNELTDISVLNELPNLTQLDLSSNPLIDISVLKELSNLTRLDLRGNNELTDISVLKELPNLTRLDLRDNELTDISVLKELPNLTQLYLSDNRLTDISVLKELPNLTQLYLRSNQLTDISMLKKLPNLTRLDLSSNQLTDISVLKELLNLTRLYLSYNKLTDISVLKERPNLTRLYLSYNKLTDISVLKELPNLTQLDLSNTKLTDISVLKELPNLTQLYLSDNHLTDISMLKELPNLTRLNLSNNKLKNIPPEFFNRDWEIHWESRYVPDGFNLFGNPLETPPVEIVRKGRKAILRYFASLEGDRKKLNEVKVLLVGAGGSGKTSLLKRIFGEPFDKKESQTKGIVIRDKRYRKEGQAVKAHFWDFGGQVIMHSSHQFFLSRRSLYILVLDGRKEEEAEYWLQLIESFGGNSPILVVLNKMDENPGFELNRRFLQKKYKRILGFHRISCKDDKKNGIKDKDGLINGIRSAFDEVEMIGTQWGDSWFKVKKELEKIKTDDDPFIDSTAYQRICEKVGITETEDQETLVDYLNDLGVILHFKDLDLSDMHILDPHWVTDAVYRIINSKKLADNHGQLQADDLKVILKKRRTSDFSYPVGKHHYILKLMGKFELCYRMADDDRVLVPDLQDVQEPEIPSFGDSPLQFYFQYSYLPSSVLPRFTVRMHDEIVGELRWRTGLVVRNSDFNATAVVKSDKDRKRICIEVHGDHKREYFSCIRREFFRIHDGFNKLGVTQCIPLPDDENEAVTYANLYGHWRAGKTEYFHGETGRSYPVSRLLDGIETEEERFARFLQSMGIEAKDIKGKTLKDINIFIQNIIGEHARGLQSGKMRDYKELMKILERKKKG
jgi:internalin A